MSRNTSVTIDEHFTNFVNSKEERESKLENLHRILARGEAQLDRGEGVDGETFISDLLN